MRSKKTIPLFDLKREYRFLKQEIGKQLKATLVDQRWILGDRLRTFEEKAAQYLGVKKAVGVGSGTDALVLALHALALKRKKKTCFDRGDEIITTPFTFLATAEAIVRAGATPVFVDICPDTFTISPSAIKEAITENTVGIVPVHLYGLGCAMDEIVSLAKEYNLFIVEDTAQAFGASINRKKLGTFGDCGAFSFFPSKPVGGFGDGGLVVTNDTQLEGALRALRNHGQLRRFVAEYIGYNSRLDSLQAAVLSVKLRHIEELNTLRRKVASYYTSVLREFGKIKAPFEPEGHRHVYHLYTAKIHASLRDKLISYLSAHGVESRVYYPVGLHTMNAFKRVSKTKSLKNFDTVISEVFTIPVFPFLTEKEKKHITDTLGAFFKGKNAQRMNKGRK